MLEKSFGATKAVEQITLKNLILRVGDKKTSKMPAHARNSNNARACISPNKRQVRSLSTGRKNGFTSNLPSANMMQNYVCPRANL